MTATRQWPLTAYLDTLNESVFILSGSTDRTILYENPAAASEKPLDAKTWLELCSATKEAQSNGKQSQTVDLSERTIEISFLSPDNVLVCKFMPLSATSQRETLVHDSRAGLEKVMQLPAVSLRETFSNGAKAGLEEDVPMLRLLFDFPFEKTPWGPSARWSPVLKTAAFVALSLPFPCCLCWSRQKLVLYNDSYSKIAGSKHPQMFALPAAEAWPELWTVLDPIANQVLDTGRAVYSKDARLFLETSLEVPLLETWADWTYVPIMDESGSIEGFFNIVVEHTESTLTERRNRLIRNLSSAIGARRHSTSDVARAATQAMQLLPEDLPFAAIYVLQKSEEGGYDAILASEFNCPQAREHIRLSVDPAYKWSTDAPNSWPLLDLLTSRHEIVKFKGLPTEGNAIFSTFGDVVDTAAMVSVGFPNLPRAILICGLNTRSTFDDSYKEFILSISKTLNTAMLVARERETEELSLTAKVNARRAEEAEAARKAQESFLEVFSHEIRNPTSAIAQASELLESNFHHLQEMVGRLDSPQISASPSLAATVAALKQELQEGSDTALSVTLAARHQQNISSDMLSASRMADGLISVAPVDVLIIEEFENIAKFFSAQADKAGVKLQVLYGTEITPDLVLRVDPTRLAQIVVNLLTNSLRMLESHDGEKRCTLFVNLLLRPPSLEGRYAPPTNQDPSIFSSLTEPFFLLVSVQDTGPGMDNATLSTLFTRFNSLNHTSHENRLRGAGTGLGLYLSRKLAQLQQGNIGVWSEVDHGCTFSFYISIFLGDPTKVKSKTPKRISHIGKAAVVPPRTDSRMGKDRHILVVEDNAISQKLLKRQLEKAGFMVSVASNGKEALDILEGSSFDACLLDVEMPVMDGLTCITRIRQKEQSLKLNRLPVAAITGNARQAQLDEALACGMDRVITKPYAFQSVIDFIQETTSETSA